ncbi:major facilitator superfamily domain-containing protein [Chaetomium strumarium]|uniref:Major facilitator superfamily domain-containing protein n=1 Tax=Chaetomium strumarium TaxID=1170767 RepID=A0AAJ0M1J2_9PEZI|nr:major facilitator superfamily domain-containing protein [Chaetomium strumarium]
MNRTTYSLISIGLVRATEAIAWSSIFPYAYYMIESFEVLEHDIAFYAGALVGVFTFGEFLTNIVWARVSDHIGRKPTLMIGTLCSLIAALSLGLSRSVAMAIASCAFGGLFNPNVGLHEHFLSLPLSHLSGEDLFGPVLGGLLAKPVASYPYPYLLPNLVVGLLQILTLLLTFMFLQETHSQLIERRDPGLAIVWLVRSWFGKESRPQRGVYAPLPDDSVSQEGPQASAETHELDDLEDQAQEAKAVPTCAFTLQVLLQILAVSLLAFHKMSADALSGTFLSLEAPSVGGLSFPHTRGGFGFSTRTIGIIFLTKAIFRVIIQPTFIPWFISKLGALRAFRCVLGLYPAMYLATPFLPNLPSPLGLMALLPDLWIKVALSSVGYVCSAIL